MKEKYKKIKAPFGYFGSKNKLAFRLCRELPPHNCWVEAFCGSSALTLAKKPAPIEIINDINNDIVNLFRQLRTKPKELIRSIELTPYAEEELTQARIADVKNLDDLERARLFLIKSMMAINGVFGKEKGGFSYCESYTRNGYEARVNRWNNLGIRLDRVVNRLKGVRIENKDARKVLSRYSNRPATLVYLDPPYLADRTNGYDHEANDLEFHQELLQIANHSNCMIFISGYENNFYNSALAERNGWTKESIETSTRDSKGNTHARTEVVWMNKHFNRALKTKRVPIRLSASEKKQNKVNPTRL